MFCLLYVGLNFCLQDTTNTLVHIAELNDLIQVLILVGDGHFLCYGKQRTLTHRLLFATESIILAQFNDGTLKQVELIVNKRKVHSELSITLIICFELAIITEVEQTLDDILLPFVNQTKSFLWLFIFIQQTFLNHLVSIGTSEVDTSFETTLNTRKVIFLLLFQISESRINIHLRSNHNRSTSVGFINQTFCNSLQTQHTMNILANELTDLIYKEDKARAWFLFLQMILH